MVASSLVITSTSTILHITVIYYHMVMVASRCLGTKMVAMVINGKANAYAHCLKSLCNFQHLSTASGRGTVTTTSFCKLD